MIINFIVFFFASALIILLHYMDRGRPGDEATVHDAGRRIILTAALHAHGMCASDCMYIIICIAHVCIVHSLCNFKVIVRA